MYVWYMVEYKINVDETCIYLHLLTSRNLFEEFRLRVTRKFSM